MGLTLRSRYDSMIQGVRQGPGPLGTAQAPQAANVAVHWSAQCFHYLKL
jgi:hypothetical protein